MQNSRAHWSHREPRKISKWLLRMMIALFVLFLLVQLSGCTNTRTVYVSVPVIPLPASLTAETPQPDLPDPFTWGASLNLNVALLSALAQCNRDKADIRTFEKNRAAQTKTQINSRRTLPASFTLVGCLPQATWSERFFSRKPGCCSAAAD